MEPGTLKSALGMQRGRPEVEVMRAFVVPLAIAVVIGIAALWPQGTAPRRDGMGETLGSKVVATLVGSIGLVLAAALTTAVAAYLAVRRPAKHVSAAGAHAH